MSHTFGEICWCQKRKFKVLKLLSESYIPYGVECPQKLLTVYECMCANPMHVIGVNYSCGSVKLFILGAGLWLHTRVSNMHICSIWFQC